MTNFDISCYLDNTQLLSHTEPENPPIQEPCQSDFKESEPIKSIEPVGQITGDYSIGHLIGDFCMERESIEKYPKIGDMEMDASDLNDMLDLFDADRFEDDITSLFEEK
jgi:hypothetical protein